MNIDEFVATFDKERLTYFPDEEISLEIEEDINKSIQQIVPQATGNLSVNAKWGWNTVLNPYQYSSHYLYGYKRVAIFTQPLYGRLDQWDLVCGEWRFMRTSDGAGTWASTWVGCDSGYGSKVQCISSGGCKAHLITHLYNFDNSSSNQGKFITNSLSRKCIDVPGAPGQNDGAQLQLATCELSGINPGNNSVTDQKWLWQ